MTAYEPQSTTSSTRSVHHGTSDIQPLYLYLIAHPDGVGYQTYHWAVVVAHNEEDARLVHPSGTSEWPDNGEWVRYSDAHRILVEKIGTADPHLAPGTVIRAKYDH